MKCKNNFYTLAFLLVSAVCFGQDNTIFITSDDYKPKKDEPYEGSFYYTQVGFSIPITVNDDDDDLYYTENDNTDGFWDQFAFDGLSLNGGAGIHLKKWAALGINTGIDSRISAKLVAVPVYGTVTLNPHFGGDASVLMQYGYGHAFAIGRGDLSGAYSKYKLGVHIDNYILIYLDATTIDLPVTTLAK